MAGRPQRRIPASIPRLGRTDTLTAGAKKALGAFISDYGSAEGPRIFVQAADERAEGNTVRQKVNNFYKKGATHS